MTAKALTRELYFTTTTVVDWLDVFTRPRYKHIIVESLEIVARAEDYSYSSARNYAGMDGLLKVIVAQ